MIEELKQEIHQEALNIYKTIYPCGNRSSVTDCFMIYDNNLVLFFNVENGSTKAIRRKFSERN